MNIERINKAYENMMAIHKHNKIVDNLNLCNYALHVIRIKKGKMPTDMQMLSLITKHAVVNNQALR